MADIYDDDTGNPGDMSYDHAEQHAESFTTENIPDGALVQGLDVAGNTVTGLLDTSLARDEYGDRWVVLRFVDGPRAGNTVSTFVRESSVALISRNTEE